MRCVKILLVAGVAVIASIGASLAADLRLPPPPPPVPEPIAEFSGWYLRGDVGVAFPTVSGERGCGRRKSACHDWTVPWKNSWSPAVVPAPFDIAT